MSNATDILLQSAPRKKPARVVIYPQDVENITGVRPRTARAVLQNIRKARGKLKHQEVTIKDYCWYTGIEEELVREFME